MFVDPGKSMNLCPRSFGADMTDQANLDYCREIQRKEGALCRKKQCAFCVVGELVGANKNGAEPERPTPVQRGLF